MAEGPGSLADLLDLDRLASLGVDLDGEAVTDGSMSHTWHEYARQADQVAMALQAVGVRHRDRVAIRLPKTAWSFVVVHGILRSGAVVVPVDPLAAPDHAASVIADAEVSAIVTDHRLRAATDLVTTIGVPVVVAEAGTSWAQSLHDGGVEVAVVADDVSASAGLPPVSPSPEDDAYLIYTSGSTGRPKGIVHTHASALAYADAAASHYRVGPADRAASVAGLHFDQSTFELYAAPLAGATVVVVPDVVLRFPASTVDLLDREQTTIWYTVPHVLRQLVERGGLDGREWPAVRLVKYGGESYPPALLAELMGALPKAVVSNVYGPAEVNQCTAFELPAPPVGDEAIPLGAAWGAAAIAVVDPDDRGAEIDVGVGELLVAGPTMMRGYWNRPDLTAERIIEREGGRWYVTGDLVDRFEDGTLRFVGRSDNQVKVRGQRVELEAVDAALAAAPSIHGSGVTGAVAVVDRSDPAGDVVVAVVERPDGSTDDTPIETTDGLANETTDRTANETTDRTSDGAAGFARRLVAELAAVLPAAAIPTRVVAVRALPRTTSGKIDRLAAQGLVGSHSA